MTLPTGLTGYALAGLGIALALSLAANGVVTHAWLGARDELATARQEARTNLSAAKACSDGVESLRSAAAERAAKAEGARDAAMALATAAGKSAYKIMSKPPAVPGNDCASARVQVDEWISGRGAK